MEKRRKYERRVIEVEHGTFTPFVMSTSGGMGPSASVTVKRLASLLAEKSPLFDDDECDPMQAVLFTFNSSIMCVRGARSSFRRPATVYNSPALISSSRPHN